MLKKSKLFSVVLLLTILFSSAVNSNATGTIKQASTAKAKISVQTLKGYLIDVDCSKVKDPAKHTRECSLMPGCEKSGYGIDVKQKNGTYKFFKFDSKGQKLAKAYLLKTKKKDNLTISVTGIITGINIKVSTLIEENIKTENKNTKSTSTPTTNKDTSSSTQEFTGWIIDSDCVGVDPVKHSTMCLQMPACISSGLGILVYAPDTSFSNYKFIEFDISSQKYGVNLINNIPESEPNNVTIKITGTLVDGYNDSTKQNEKQLHITSISFTDIKGVSTVSAPSWSETATESQSK